MDPFKENKKGNGDLDWSCLFQKIAKQQDPHIQNLMEFGTFNHNGDFFFNLNEQIY